MNWDCFRKGQEVRIRSSCGWMRGHVTDVHSDSVSAVVTRGATEKLVRVSDLRNITPWKPNDKSSSLESADQRLIDW